MKNIEVEELIKLAKYELNKFQWFLNEHEEEYDDMLGKAICKMTERINDYNEERGKKSTFFIKIANGVYKTYIRDYGRYRNKVETTLDNEIECEYGVLTKKDIILVEEDYSTVNYKELMEFVKTSSLKNIEEILEMKMQGLSEREIGEHFGVSKQCINKKIKRLRKLVQEEFGLKGV